MVSGQESYSSEYVRPELGVQCLYPAKVVRSHGLRRGGAGAHREPDPSLSNESKHARSSPICCGVSLLSGPAASSPGSSSRVELGAEDGAEVFRFFVRTRATGILWSGHARDV